MACKTYLTYLAGHQFIVDAEVIEVAGQRIVRGMTVLIPMDLPEGVVDPSGPGEYYIDFPEDILDNCYTKPESGAPTLREHFRKEVLTRDLSIVGHLDETP